MAVCHVCFGCLTLQGHDAEAQPQGGGPRGRAVPRQRAQRGGWLCLAAGAQLNNTQRAQVVTVAAEGARGNHGVGCVLLLTHRSVRRRLTLTRTSRPSRTCTACCCATRCGLCLRLRVVAYCQLGAAHARLGSASVAVTTPSAPLRPPTNRTTLALTTGQGAQAGGGHGVRPALRLEEAAQAGDRGQRQPGAPAGEALSAALSVSTPCSVTWLLKGAGRLGTLLLQKNSCRALTCPSPPTYTQPQKHHHRRTGRLQA